MNLTKKTLIVLFSTFALINCQDAGTGHRLGGLGGFRGNSQALTQTGDNFKNIPVDSEAFKALVASRNPQVVKESPIATIDYSSDKDSRAVCLEKGAKGADTDEDGLPDDCELEYYPNTFNGWMSGGREYDPNDPQLQLTPQEEGDFKQISKAYGGLNLGNLSPTMKKIFKKFELARQPGHSDVDPLQYVFYELSYKPLRISDRFASYNRNDAFEANKTDDMNIGLPYGDGDETVPTLRNTSATHPADVTSFGDDLNSMLTTIPVTTAWYTNVTIPKDSTHLEVAMAREVDGQLRVVPKTTALYFIINNNDTIMLNSQLISSSTGKKIAKDFGKIYPNYSCVTGNLLLFSFGVPQNEVLAFRSPGSKTWTTLNQSHFTLQPMGDVKCQQAVAGSTAYGASKAFFNTSSDIAQRVPGVINFNSTFGNGTTNDSEYMYQQGASLDGIKAALEALPITDMNSYQVQEFRKGLGQLQKAGFTDQKDKDWLAAVSQQAKDRDYNLNNPTAAANTLAQIAQLNQKLAGLDPSSKDYADTEAEIKKLLGIVGSNTALTAAQKQELADKTKGFDDAKKAAAANAAAKAAAAEAARRTVQYDPKGDVDLTAESAQMLKSLGFTIKDEKGNDISSGFKAAKINDATLDNILQLFEERIQKGNLSQGEAAAMSKVLEDLKKSKGVDQDKIKDFENEHGPALAAASAVKWTPEQIDYLKTLEADPKVNPGFTAASLDKWSKGFAGTSDEAKAKEEALAKLEKALLNTAPDSLTKFPIADRKPYVDALKASGFLDEKKYNDWIWKLNFLALWPKDERMNKFTFKEIVVNGAKFRAMDININFATGKSDLNKNARNYLKFAVEVIRQIEQAEGKQFYFLIQAHTDTKGKPESNLKLSQKRGDSVLKFVTGSGLGANKLDTARVKAVGMGETQPLYTKPDGSEDFESNRRVEIVYGENPF